jgi:hypothetical protein
MFRFIKKGDMEKVPGRLEVFLIMSPKIRAERRRMGMEGVVLSKDPLCSSDPKII